MKLCYYSGTSEERKDVISMIVVAQQTNKGAKSTRAATAMKMIPHISVHTHPKKSGIVRLMKGVATRRWTLGVNVTINVLTPAQENRKSGHHQMTLNTLSVDVKLSVANVNSPSATKAKNITNALMMVFLTLMSIWER